MDTQALTDVVASGAIGVAVNEPISNTVLLGWCFTMGSLSFGVFGFLYGVFATIRLGDKGHLAIVNALITFCKFIAAFLCVISVLSIYIAYSGKVRWEVYILIGCFVGFSWVMTSLAKNMKSGGV